jgi:hypothetical protein
VIVSGSPASDCESGSFSGKRKAANMFLTELRERFARFGVGLRARIISFE